MEHSFKIFIVINYCIFNLNYIYITAPDGILDEFVSIEKIKWSVKSFKPYKAAGTDKVYPIMLQRADGEIYNILQKIFKACLKYALIPSEWSKARVVFIPKPGRFNHCKAKDFRPLSLTSFCSKPLKGWWIIISEPQSM